MLDEGGGPFAPETDRFVIGGLYGLLAGALALASFGAVRTWTRLGPSDALPYLAVLLTGVGLCVAVRRRVRAAVLVLLAACAGQVFAMVGLIWELRHGIAIVKAQQLRVLGVPPVAGIVVNLVYSATAWIFFGVVVARVRRRRRYRPATADR